MTRVPRNPVRIAIDESEPGSLLTIHKVPRDGEERSTLPLERSGRHPSPQLFLVKYLTNGGRGSVEDKSSAQVRVVLAPRRIAFVDQRAILVVRDCRARVRIFNPPSDVKEALANGQRRKLPGNVLGLSSPDVEKVSILSLARPYLCAFHLTSCSALSLSLSFSLSLSASKHVQVHT